MRSIRDIELRGTGLLKDFGWVFSGNVVYAASQWLIVLVLSKLGSPEKLGEYALGIAVVTPILVAANLQIRALVASDIQDQYSFRHYLKFRAVTLVAAMAIVVIFVLTDRHSWHLRGVILVLGVCQTLEYLADTYYGRMQKFNRLDRVSRSSMMKGPLSLLALALIFYFTRDVFWACLGLLLGRLTIVVFYDARFHSGPAQPAAAKVGDDWDWRPMYHLLLTAWPLGVIALLASLNGNIPRYFIDAHSGTRSLGIFAALYSLVAIGTLFINAFGQSVFVPAATAFAARDVESFRGIVRQFTLLAGGLGFAAVAVAALFGQRLLAVLYRPEYANGPLLVQLMIVGGVYWVSTAQGYILTAIRWLKAQIVVLGLTVVVAIAACAWMVPSMGLMGAAHALQLSAVVQWMGSAYLLWRARIACTAVTYYVSPNDSDSYSETLEGRLTQDATAGDR